MRIPKYIIKLMENSTYNYCGFYSKQKKYSVGYTIDIKKESYYTHIGTLKKDIELLKKWVEKQNGGHIEILFIPNKTKYCEQYATITIFDPVMQKLEKYIPFQLTK